ncbi:MAG TPA: hypothetical protein VIU38_12560 [Anaerolineales bacterium]
MRGDALYAILSRTLDMMVWGGELSADSEPLPSGPAVFVSNHAGAMGPIAVTSSVRVRFHPWVIGDMLDLQTAGPYLREDFVKPTLHVPEPMATSISNSLAHVTVALLRTIGCIPVFHDKDLLETYRLSDDYLAMGRGLLIFPEDPKQSLNSRTGLRPFQTGFAHLGSLFAQRTGHGLKFYPIAVHRNLLRVQLGQPVTYNPNNQPAAERRRIAHLLESIIAAMLASDDRQLQAAIHQTP